MDNNNNNNNNLFVLVRFGDDVNDYVYCIASRDDVDRILNDVGTRRSVTFENNIITISGNLPDDNNDPDFVVVGSKGPADDGNGGGDGNKIKIMVLPESSNDVESALSDEQLQLARTLLKLDDELSVKQEDIKSNINQLIKLRNDLRKGGGRRRSSTTRKSSSSRRRRASSRSTKKRSTLRKQKRRQRRAH